MKKVDEDREDDARCKWPVLLNDDTGNDGVQETSTSIHNGPILIMDMMGGIDGRVEGVIVDGDQFYDADEDLVESDDDSSDSDEDDGRHKKKNMVLNPKNNSIGKSKKMQE